MTGIYGLMIEFNPVLGPHNRTVQYPEPTTATRFLLSQDGGNCFPPFSLEQSVLLWSVPQILQREINKKNHQKELKEMEAVRSRRSFASPEITVQTLPLYRSAPVLEVRLEDFELYAIDRLRGFPFLQFRLKFLIPWLSEIKIKCFSFLF